MKIEIPAYVEERLRQPMPDNHFIVKNSTPVLSFGDSRTAHVATLGLNPSRIEFLDKKGEELLGPNRRLETLTSLQIPSLADASIEVLEKVVEGCYSYFLRQPYWQWFGQLEPILQLLGTSYKTGTACHLDLVQWATDPVWGKIPDPVIRQKLITADANFLREQLRSNSIGLLLLNGSSVIKIVQKTFGLVLHRHPKTLVSRSTKTDILVGSGPFGIPVIGWTVNIQSSFGVTNELRQSLADEVSTVRANL
jgi:hypothetical protein